MGMSNRRYVVAVFIAAVLFAGAFVSFFRNNRPADTFGTSYPGSAPLQPQILDSARPGSMLLDGPAIAPKLGNETAKVELGRAAWKLFHTTLARFPDRPTASESESLRAYLHLFQRLYPCGECAEHFGGVLRRFPPQVSGRSAAAAWGCHVHNEVNKSLEKELFDCSKIGDFYDCGCADDEETEVGPAKPVSRDSLPEDERLPVNLEKEDLQRGG